MINIFSFAGHMVSVATIWLCCYSRTVCVVWLLTKTGSGPALTFRIYQADTGCSNSHIVIFVPLYLAYLFLWLFVRFIYLSLIAVVFFTFLEFVGLLDLWVHSHDSSVCFLGLPLHICWATLYGLTSHWFSVVSVLLSLILNHFYCSVLKFSNHFFLSV